MKIQQMGVDMTRDVSMTGLSLRGWMQILSELFGHLVHFLHDILILTDFLTVFGFSPPLINVALNISFGTMSIAWELLIRLVPELSGIQTGKETAGPVPVMETSRTT